LHRYLRQPSRSFLDTNTPSTTHIAIFDTLSRIKAFILIHKPILVRIIQLRQRLFATSCRSRVARHSLIVSPATRETAQVKVSQLPRSSLVLQSTYFDHLTACAADPHDTSRQPAIHLQRPSHTPATMSSGKLDQSLDEILSVNKRSGVRGRGRQGRRVSRPGKTAAVAAPIGGIKKSTKQAKGGAKAIPTGPSGGSGDSRIQVSNLVSANDHIQSSKPF
jgi:hypothetical protein